MPPSAAKAAGQDKSSALPTIGQVRHAVTVIEKGVQAKLGIAPDDACDAKACDAKRDAGAAVAVAAPAPAAVPVPAAAQRSVADLPALEKAALDLVTGLLDAAAPAPAAAVSGAAGVSGAGAAVSAPSATPVSTLPSLAKFRKLDEESKHRIIKDIGARLKEILIWPYPLGNFVRYKIYYAGRKANPDAGRKKDEPCRAFKIFDHIFDAQRESFDLNEFNILDMTVRRVVAEAVDRHIPGAGKLAEYKATLQSRADEMQRLRGFAAAATAETASAAALAAAAKVGQPTGMTPAPPVMGRPIPDTTVGGAGGAGPVATYPVSASAAGRRAATGGAGGRKPPAPKPPPSQTLATTIKVAARTARNRPGAAAAAADADADADAN